MSDNSLWANGSRAETRKPCAICGWAAHMAIHQPVVSGARKGQPWGHKYAGAADQKSRQGAQNESIQEQP